MEKDGMRKVDTDRKELRDEQKVKNGTVKSLRSNTQ